MSSQPKAVVLLSGGMDSCVTAAMARRTHELALLHASYSQRAERRERQAFDEIADFYSVPQRLVGQLDHYAQIGGPRRSDDPPSHALGAALAAAGRAHNTPTPPHRHL